MEKIKKIWMNYFDESETKILFWILFVGFLLRLLFVVETQNSPFIQNLFSDSKIYNSYALNIIQSNNWIGDKVFFMSPVYPYFLAVTYKIFGQSLYVVRLIQVFVSSLTILVAYLIGRKLFSKFAGYLSAAIFSVYSTLIFYSGIILSETLQVFVSSLLILFLISDFKDASKKWFVVGIFLGILALFRANILLFALVLIFYLLYRLYYKKGKTDMSFKSVALYVFGMILVIAPITLRNYIVEKDFVLLTSNGGINFYIGNNENSIGVFVTPKEFNFSADMAGEKFAEKFAQRDLLPSEASSYWYGQGFQFIKENPIAAGYLFLNKIMLFFLPEENPQSSSMDEVFFRENYSRILQLPLINFSIISVLFVFGIILMWKHRSDYTLIYLFIASYLLASIIFFVNGRFRLALLPVIIPVAAFSITNVFESFAKKDFTGLKKAIIITAVFTLLVNVFAIKPKFTDYEAYQHLGDIAYNENRLDDAIYNYNISLIYQDNFMTFVNLGNSLAKKKDYKGAEIAFKKAIERNPDYELAYFNLAFVYTQIGNFDLAIKNYNKTIELNQNFESAYRNLGIVYYVMEKYDLALEFFNEFMRISEDAKTKDLVNKDIQNIYRILENKK
jgi:4-amino-4-deoxy-L-arabinose transferase-like glycosyltransferase